MDNERGKQAYREWEKEMKDKKTCWDRLLWGIEFIDEHKEPMLIGGAWHKEMIKDRYDGEPSRPILFTTRRMARKWCNEENEHHKSGPWPCNCWKVRPVRVREIVKPKGK